MKKILIIEDNPTNMKLAHDVLKAHGYEVLLAATGEDGLKTAQTMSEEIGLILLDLKLPDMDGIEVIKNLKDMPDTRQIPVIVVSAHAMESDIRTTKEAGCADYITKPINLREFLDKVEGIMKHSQ